LHFSHFKAKTLLVADFFGFVSSYKTSQLQICSKVSLRHSEQPISAVDDVATLRVRLESAQCLTLCWKTSNNWGHKQCSLCDWLFALCAQICNP